MAFDINAFEERMWEAFLALVIFFGGTAFMVLIYIWFAWQVSLHAMRERARINQKSIKNGLSMSEIQKLPTVVCTSHAEEEEEELSLHENGVNGKKKRKKSSTDELFISGDLECIVCLEQFEDGDRCVRMPTCRHCFHFECAEAWLSNHPICPLCRANAHPNHEEKEPGNNINHIAGRSRLIDIPS